MDKGIRSQLLLAAVWLASALPANASSSGSSTGDSWQERRLLQPTTSQLRQERGGQVFIYDGVEHGTVQAAMDKHFDRIENMMFTRIHHLPPTGAGPVTVEDDGCE